MKDLIAKLKIDANCALGAIWMHIDAQAARIAELEAQIAASADTDKLREAIANISNNQITEAWESCGGVDGFYKSFGYQQFAHAILDLAADLAASTALQTPVREVPDNTHKLITSTSLIDLRGDLAVAAALGESITLSPESMKAILHAMRTGYPLPAAPVQQEGE